MFPCSYVEYHASYATNPLYHTVDILEKKTAKRIFWKKEILSLDVNYHYKVKNHVQCWTDKSLSLCETNYIFSLEIF